jgi:hypothetical protein
LFSSARDGEIDKEVTNGGHCSPFGDDFYSGSGFLSCEAKRVQTEVKVVRADGGASLRL